MRLLRADCLGYKRFRTVQEMDLYPSLVCVVGANAAGKSSFLDALTHLNDDRDFESWERTRHAGSNKTTQVRAHFELDDEDKEALAHIPEARDVGELIVWKKVGFARGFQLVPKPERNLSSRAAVVERLRKLAEHKWLQQFGPEEPVPSLIDLCARTLDGRNLDRVSASEHRARLVALVSLRSRFSRRATRGCERVGLR